MTIISWKTNSIDLNKPAKVLPGTADSFITNSLWSVANAVDDPYWSGGTNPKYYRWEVSFTIPDKTHGSNLTRMPFTFNAQDIEVGDWVAGASVGDGACCQIISIKSKTNNTLTAIIEDKFRYNTFKRSGGNGLFGCPGPVIFFQINELGLPMLDPLPGEAGVDFSTNVMSRFQYMNPLTNYLLEKKNHGFKQGDAICIENGEFVLSNSTNVVKFIGTVLHSGPSSDQFILRPFNGVIDFVPGLPGLVGDFIYPTIDGSGNLTVNPESKLPIFLKIAGSIPSITIGSSPNISGRDGDIVEINRIKVDLYSESSTGSYSLDRAIELINQKTIDHKVIADKIGYSTSARSNASTLGSAYGAVGGYIPFSARINGSEINFSTTTSGAAFFGDSSIADVNDLVSDINAANIPNITAEVSATGELIITNSIGGSIIIENILSDPNGKSFAGNDSISSLPLSTSANTTEYALRLSRFDGGPLTLYDNQGSFFNDTGVMSGQNGRYALGLMIERGLSLSGGGSNNGSGSVSVVSNISKVVQGATIKVDANFSNIDFPGGLFTIFQLDPVITYFDFVWFSGNVTKNAYSDFSSFTINKEDITFSANLQNASFLIQSSDDITIGTSIITGSSLTSLGLSSASEKYTISSSLFNEAEELSSNVAITGNLTTDRGLITFGNLYLNNLQPILFDITLSATFPMPNVPFFNTFQAITWAVSSVGTISSGIMNCEGPDLADSNRILASFGEAYGLSNFTVDSLLEYTVFTTNYSGVGLNGAGQRTIPAKVQAKLIPARIYYPIFYKINSSSNNPNFTINDPYLRINYAIGQGVESSNNTSDYLWMAIPGTPDHTFAFTYLNSIVLTSPDKTYLNRQIAGITYNIYGFTNYREVTKIYTLT